MVIGVITFIQLSIGLLRLHSYLFGYYVYIAIYWGHRVIRVLKVKERGDA